MGSATKARLILLLLSSTLVVGGYLLGGREGLVVAVFLAFSLWLFSRFWQDQRLKRRYKGRTLKGQDGWHLEKILSELAVQARIPQPRLVILDLKTPTAFSSGRSWIRATIFLSEGLLKTLDSEEIRAVMAHEVARIQRLDTFLAGVASSLTAILVGISRILGFGGHLVEELVAPLTSLPLRLLIPRKDWYLSDYRAAQYIGNSKTLARVLWKLHSAAGACPLEGALDTAPLFIVSPLTSKSYHRYFVRQPSVEKRIEKLVGHFPI